MCNHYEDDDHGSTTTDFSILIQSEMSTVCSGITFASDFDTIKTPKTPLSMKGRRYVLEMGAFKESSMSIPTLDTEDDEDSYSYYIDEDSYSHYIDDDTSSQSCSYDEVTVITEEFTIQDHDSPSNLQDELEETMRITNEDDDFDEKKMIPSLNNCPRRKIMSKEDWPSERAVILDPTRDLSRRRGRSRQAGIRQMRCWPSQYAVMNVSSSSHDQQEEEEQEDYQEQQTLQERLVSVQEVQIKRLEERSHPFYYNTVKAAGASSKSVEQVQRDRLEARMALSIMSWLVD